MRADASLRRRLVAACVLLAIVIGGVFAAAAFVIVESVEHELIDARLSRAAEQLLAQYRARVPVSPPTDLRFEVGAQIPAELQALAPGLYELTIDDRGLHVLIGSEDGERYAVIDDKSDFERIELVAYVALAMAFIAGVLLAVAIGRASANRVIAPVTTLAELVQREDWPERHPLLDGRDEIGVLARAFDAKTSQLRAFLVRERVFTADVSHELRTPLTVMLGAAELLAARLGDRPELQAAAERIRRTADETSGRVSALLQLARSPESIERRPLDLRPIVEQELERCRPLLNGKPVRLDFDASTSAWVQGAPELAAIAVGNLLRNACQFTERGSVHVCLAPGVLVVEDTGPGIPSAIRGRVFEAFVRGRDEYVTGSGMGLSIVKRVAEHLGWSLRLEDTPAGGSRFTVTFPGTLTRS